MSTTAQSRFPTILVDKLDAIRQLAADYDVARLEVFGSVMTDAFDPARSDIDFLVTYPDDYDYGPWLGRVQELEDRLGATLGRNVDLVMAGALRRDRFRRAADLTRKVVFDASAVDPLA